MRKKVVWDKAKEIGWVIVFFLSLPFWLSVIAYWQWYARRKGYPLY